MAKSRDEVEAAIKQSLGLVPHFFSRILHSLFQIIYEGATP